MLRAYAAPNSDCHPDEFVEFAHALEEAGWDGLFVYDHLQLDPSWGVETLDSYVLLAAVARETQRLRLGTAVTPISRRRPWQLAKELVTLDHLSHGRVIAGIGLGGLDEFEFAPFGDDSTLRERAAKTDEGLELLDAFLRGEQVRHDGAYYTVDAHLRPAAVQSPRPPIYIAATFPFRASVDRAKRWDGVFCNVKLKGDGRPLTPAELREYVGDLLDSPNMEVASFHHPEHDLDEYEQQGLTWLVELGPVTDDWLSQAHETVAGL